MAASTRERIITTAERLFAEQGISSVSFRQIAEAAGQRNQGVVQYHFGSKEELLRAIVEHRVKPYNERRLELLAALDARGHGNDLRGLVDAAIRPLAELGAAQYHYVAFVAQLTLQGSIQDTFRGVADELDAGARVLAPRLNEVLPDVPPPLREGRLTAAFATALFAIARYHEQRATAGTTLVSTELFVEDLVGSITAFLAAPPPTTLLDHLEPAMKRTS